MAYFQALLWQQQQQQQQQHVGKNIGHSQVAESEDISARYGKVTQKNKVESWPG